MPVRLFHDDCLNILPTLEESSVDSIVTDPPYLLNFMGKPWDRPDQLFHLAWATQALRVLKPGGFMVAFSGTRTYHRMAVAVEDAGFEVRDQLCWLNSQGMPHGLNIAKALTKSGHDATAWEGFHTALKPCVEPILLAQKPFLGTVVDNVLRHGTGGLNIDGCRIAVDPEIDDPRLGGEGSWSTGAMAKNAYGDFAGDRVGSSPLGRFPSGVIHDGSPEVMEVFASFGEKASGAPGRRRKPHETHSMSGTLDIMDRDEVGYADRGGVGRFFKACEYTEEERRIFYCGKVKPKERGSSKHPTLKPLALMRYLCRLVTPKGGLILDPFAGSGTTGQAAIEEGFDAILIEREQEYVNDCERRLVLFLE
jgi:hypothetical protein